MLTDSLLNAALAVSTPIILAEYRARPLVTLIEEARQFGQVLAEHGDDLLFKSRRAGGSAEAFTTLSRGIIVLSFMPGGVDFLGVHYENIHPDIERAEITRDRHME